MSNLWDLLKDYHRQTNDRPILSLFDDESRFDTFSAKAGDLLLDYSKTNIDAQTLSLLLDLAKASGVAEKRDAMFRGDKINVTEDRAVLHTALRSGASTPLLVDGADIRPAIAAGLDHMERFSTGVRSGKITASGGARFTDVVNIGIGGSDLGPVMATQALAPYHDGPRCHFVSNVDAAHITETLKWLDPATTLIIIASKTFTTVETMTNAQTAVNWLRARIGNDVGTHLAAVSTAMEKTAEMGIAPDRVFGFADWFLGSEE